MNINNLIDELESKKDSANKEFSEKLNSCSFEELGSVLEERQNYLNNEKQKLYSIKKEYFG